MERAWEEGGREKERERNKGRVQKLCSNNGRNDEKGDGETGGVEVLVYSKELGPIKSAKEVCKSIARLGFRNRGIKYRPELMFLNATKAPAMLVECCFIDDADDVKIYNFKIKNDHV